MLTKLLGSDQTHSESWDCFFYQFIERNTCGFQIKTKNKKKVIDVVPGKSVIGVIEVLNNYDDDYGNDVQEIVDEPSSKDEDAVDYTFQELESEHESRVNIAVKVDSKDLEERDFILTNFKVVKLFRIML